jgi:O-antigen ligase
MVFSPTYVVGVAAAVALPLLLWRHAASVVVLIALLTQWANLSAAPVTGLGDAVYDQGKVPTLLLLAVTAAVVCLVRLRSAGRLAVGRSVLVALALLSGLVLLTTIVGLNDGQSLASAINQNARPFIACAVGLAVGLGVAGLPGEERFSARTAGVALVLMATAGVAAVPLGWSADPRVSPYFIFLDSALPTFAGAAFLALIMSGRLRDWRTILVVSASLVIVLLSFRRAVWLAIAIPVVLGLLLIRNRRRMVVRLVIAALGLGVVVAVAPGLRADVYVRLTGGPASHVVNGVANPSAPAGSGGGGGSGDGPDQTAASPEQSAANVAEDSSEGHLSDMAIGWDLVKAHFWTGLGPRAKPVPGLAHQNTKVIYIHDEWLEEWVRYGPLAPLLLTALLLSFVVMAIRVMRRRGSRVPQLAAATFVLLTPLIFVLFAHFSSSARWSLMVGMAAGVLGWRQDNAGRHRVEALAHNGLPPAQSARTGD